MGTHFGTAWKEYGGIMRIVWNGMGIIWDTRASMKEIWEKYRVWGMVEVYRVLFITEASKFTV